MSKLQKLRLENIHLMDDGVIAAEYDMKLREIVKDIFERPTLDKVRSINLELSLVPSKSRQFRVDTRVKITKKIPASRSGDVQMTLQDGELRFNPESLDDVDQMTIDQTIATDEHQHAELDENED